MPMMKDILQALDLGNSVAEYDAALERYFVETDTFRRMIKDQVDIVAGDKGTGKTALFSILTKRARQISDLSAVELIPAFNVTGSPVFQRITEGEPFTEAQYMTMWKAYVVSLAGNWILSLYEKSDYTTRVTELESLLERTGLLSPDDSPTTVFSSIVNLFRRIMDPKSVEVTISITPQGLPIVIPKVVLGEGGSASEEYIEHDKALRLVDDNLADLGVKAWLILDRLDEAFAGLPAAEIPALRALFRTYLDLNPFSNLKLKIFVRRDLFRRIIHGGFVNLTHVNARKVEIYWDEDSLKDLFYKRVKENPNFLQLTSCEEGGFSEIFSTLFPQQVDPGSRKPRTWKWLMSRVRDGNDVKPPRNLIDLIQKAQLHQIRIEERQTDPNEFALGHPLVSADSLKEGLRALSKQRVEDTLLAEAGTQAHLIERFRNGKAEHNRETIATTIGSAGDDLGVALQFLRDVGFLEAVGTNFKVPMLYRDGLGITQGKAFSPEADEEAGEEDMEDE